MIWVRGLKPRQRAINDCVDRKDGKNELATFRNIMNEWYAKDTSNKNQGGIQVQNEGGAEVQRLHSLWLQERTGR